MGFDRLKGVNRFIVQLIRDNPGITTPVLEHKAKGWGLSQTPKITFCGGHYFHMRLNTLMQRGYFFKLLVKGTNQYYPSEMAPPAEFDISNSTDRLVAADFVTDKGNEQLASDLRIAKRGTICND